MLVSDITGYCVPQWTTAIRRCWSASTNPPLAEVIGTPPPKADWQVLLVGSDDSARKDLHLRAFAPPADAARETAPLYDQAGGAARTVDVYRIPIADVDLSMVLVPSKLPGQARAIKLDGPGRPLRLDLMPEARSFVAAAAGR